MSNPLRLIDILLDDTACYEVMVTTKYCFNYPEHEECALKNIIQLKDRNNPEDKNNIFGIYRQDTIIGITGLWYDKNPLLNDFAFLRWTGLQIQYRGFRLFPYVIELLEKEAIRNNKSFLIEIAWTEKAKEAFEKNGFTLVPDNDKYIKFILDLIGEEKGNYILVKSLNGKTINWNELYTQSLKNNQNEKIDIPSIEECDNIEVLIEIENRKKEIDKILTGYGFELVTSPEQLSEKTLVMLTSHFVYGGKNIPNLHFYGQHKSFIISQSDYRITDKLIYYLEFDLKNTKYEKEYIIDSWEHRIKTRLDAIK